MQILSGPTVDTLTNKFSCSIWGDPIGETVVSLHTWLFQDFPFQSDHCSTELRPTGEAEVSSAGEQLTKE
jgi:hypothetical protein